MKKIAILLLIFLTSGCTAVRINTNSVDNITSIILSKNNNLYNRVGKGYKYYIPRGVSYFDTNDLNDKLYSNGVYYYLYIDAISYFYKTEMVYEENKELYYSKKFEGKKAGYLEIREENNKYYIKFVYNYAKIEACVEKDDIEEVILNSSYILSTVKFNDDIIELMLNDDYFTNKEEQYDKFVSKVKEDNFLPSDENKEK